MKIILLIIFLSLAFLFPLFSHPFYESHDAEAHVARFAAYFQAFLDGHFPARWAGNLNFGYGTPIFIFYYPLPGYIASAVHLLGFSFQDIFKIIVAVSFIAAPVSFYVWTKLLFKKEIAFIGALLYGFAPYHFLNLYVRGDVAELMAFVFVPLVFWAIEQTATTKKIVYILLGGIFYGLLILSHNGVSLMFSPVFLFYAWVKSTNKEIFFRLCLLLAVGLLLSSFFWIPALAEGKYTNAKMFIGNMYQHHFPTILQLIDPQWNFGPDVNSPDGLSPQIGLIHVVLVFSSLVLFLKEYKRKKLLSFWIAVFFLGIFIVLPILDVIWRNISILRLYEFPWRFIGLVSFAAAVLSCFALEYFKENKLVIALLILLLLLSSIPFIKVKTWVSHPDSYYQSFTGTTYYHGEASPVWAAGDPGSFAKQQIEFIEGNGKIVNLQKKTNIHTFEISSSQSATLVDNTYYFPGWKVFVDDILTPIQFQDPNYRGLITFTVPEGKHSVKVIFTETKIRKIADMLSVITLLIVVILLGKILYNKKIKPA